MGYNKQFDWPIHMHHDAIMHCIGFSEVFLLVLCVSRQSNLPDCVSSIFYGYQNMGNRVVWNCDTRLLRY